MAAGPDGRLLIADRGNHALRWAQRLASGTTAVECLLDWGERTYASLLAPPALSPAPGTKVAAALPASVHVVKSGDTLMNLSRRHNIAPAQLAVGRAQRERLCGDLDRA